MKINNYKLLFLISLIISSCGKNDNLRIICPVGAPSICFYKEIENNNFTTESVTPKVLAQFQEENYDAIIIDVASGLNAIKTYNKPYAFARLLTCGNLYLISVEKSNPKDGEKILSFGSMNSIPYLTLKKYCEICGKTDFVDEGIVETKDGVSSVAPILKQDLLNGKFQYNHYLLAEPVLTSLKSEKGFEDLKVTLLRDEIGYIPQAGLFLNKNSVKNKYDLTKKIIDDVTSNINDCIYNYEKVFSYLNKYDDQIIQSKFGFKVSTVKSVQEHNGFALFDQKVTYGKKELNEFFKFIDFTTYDEDSYYIDI